MPPSTRPHDPFNDAPRRPTARARRLQDTSGTGNSNNNNSGHTLRSATAATTTTTTAAAAAAGPRNLFATHISRRPTANTSNTTLGYTDVHAPTNDVLEDSDDSHDLMSRRNAATARAGSRPSRRTRAATEATTIGHDENDQFPEIADLVIRNASGGYLREVPAVEGVLPGSEEDGGKEEDARLSAIVREFWASGGGVGGRGTRRYDEGNLEKPAADIMARLREVVERKLTEERWMYEPTDYLEELRIRNHGA